MKRILLLLLAIPLLLTGCEGATSSEHITVIPKTPPAPASFPSAKPTKRIFTVAERPIARPQLVDKKGLAKLSMLSAKAKAGAMEVACDVSQYATLSGDALVFYIQDAGATCINELYAGNTNTYGAFTKAKMIDVANAATAASNSYMGVDEKNLEAMFGFLRAGYYVAYYFGENLDWKLDDAEAKSAVRLAIDAFVNNEHFYDNSDAHGAPLRELLTLIDSSDSQAEYLYVVRGWLSKWDQSYSTSWYMGSAVNEIFQILYRGHEQAAFREAVQNDTTLVYALSAFIDQSWMFNTDSEYLMDNAARELARLSQYWRAPIYAIVQEKVKAILAQYTLLDGPYLAVAELVNYYDVCTKYNTCTFAKDLEAQILTTTHVCSPTITIRAQSMSNAELSESCSLLQGEESDFHQKLATNNQPLPGDQNTSLNVVVFGSSADYMKYAGPIFGIDTNNGGMYMEGNPSVPGNQANFYCYEAEWVLPAFEVWNLKHEYIHYLDGRFNMAGGFEDYLSATTIWWIEGLAEYISHQDIYPEAAVLAKTKQYQLSQVLANDYDSGQDLVYRWGYLAVRFMFEKHQKDVDTTLGFFRVGNYPGYQTWLNGSLSAYDGEWTSWLDTVQ